MKMDELVKWFQLNYPSLVKKMQESSHHFSEDNLNPYHLEGDVWTHTMMVCDRAKEKHDFIQIAALLHDIGKPYCREVKEDKGKVAFYGHEGYSAFLALEVMKQLQKEDWVTDEGIKHVFKMIALHTDPFKEKDSSNYIHQESLLKDVLSLSRCDQNGRFHNTENKEMSVKEFDDCTILKSDEAPVIKYLIGPPLVGKTTIRASYKDKGYKVVCRDDIVEVHGEGNNYGEKFKNVDQKEVDAILQTILHHHLKQKDNIVMDMTHMSRKSRKRTLHQVPKEYIKSAVVVLSDLHTISERNEMRNSKEGKYIPWNVIEQMIRGFYPPMYTEFDEIKYILN